MRTIRSDAAFVVVGLLFAVGATFADEPPQLPDIPDLAARYDAGLLRDRLRDNSTIRTWRDASGNGHLLRDDENGRSAVIRGQRLNQQPVVHGQKAGSYSVTQPFDLSDHTIFLVYSAGLTQRALFRSDEDNESGIILRGKGGTDVYRTGGQEYPYNTPTDPRGAYTITVLARGAGRLRSFINGVDHSSGARFEDSIRVGKFFHLALSTRADADAQDLRIAEIIMYSRYLDDYETDSVTAYLAQKYRIDLEQAAAEPAARPGKDAAQAWLSTKTDENLNQSAVAVAWTTQTKAGAPFRHDPKGENTKLYCTQDGTRVRLWLTLPFFSTDPGVRLRVLILKNEEIYHATEANSGEFGGPDERAAIAELATTLSLDAGDFIEVITSRDGAEGRVILEADKAVFAVEGR